MKRLFWFFGFAALLAAFGCGGCEGNNTGEVQSGRILVTPDPVAFSQVPIGESEAVTLLVMNVEPDPLTVFEVELRARDGGSMAGLELTGVPEGEFEVTADGEVELTLTYTPQAGQPTPAAEIAFVSSDDRYSRDEPKLVPVDALGNNPRLEIVPATVRFARLPPGERDDHTVSSPTVTSATTSKTS